MKSLLILVLILVSATLQINSEECDPSMKGKCFCGYETFEGQRQYLVKCIDSHFTDTEPLQHLPADVEVLIFTGNSIKELPWNVFGTLQNYTKLHHVDMSNNGIHEILGKSYHRVSNVKRLILNHNQISISDDEHHSRMFSNFGNLEELHLTNAFKDNADNLGFDLHDIFINSKLTKLLKLHLEQNEVIGFKDRKVFCELPSILDLYLADNNLKSIDFRIDCLKHLRFIDLEGNKINHLTANEMNMLDELPARNQSLEIDLHENPYSCDCGYKQLFHWLNVTKVEVRNKDSIRCIKLDGDNSKPITCGEEEDAILVTLQEPQTHVAVVILSLLCIVLICLIAGLLYNNRKTIHHRINPLVDTVSRKVYYSSIGHNDDQEVEV